MSNPYYNPSGNPATRAQGLSATVRGEFASVSAAFDLLPTFTGNAGQAVVVNPGGTGLTVTVGQLSLAGNLSTTGAFNTIFAQSASVTLTLPGVAGTLALAASVTAETTRATAAEGVNATAISANATAISAETTRATAAEAAETAARIAAASGTLFGLTLSNDAGTPNTVLDIAAGVCADSTNTTMITLGALTKTTGGAWVAGSGTAGMGVGLTVTASTWYHVFAVIVSGTANVYFDTSVTAANKPAGTTAFRRIGSIYADGSVHILAFVQRGDRFDLVTPFGNYSGTPGDLSAHTLAAFTPPGVGTEALLSGIISDPTGKAYLYISALHQTDILPGGTVITAEANGSASFSALSGYYITVLTNTSSQFRYRMGAATNGLLIITNGWIDHRGRDF